jgi:hypothetical protein
VHCRILKAALVVVGVVSAGLSPVLARPQASRPAPAAAAPRIKVCSLVPKEEVKAHLPWIAALDQFAPEEEAIGASGSSCNYPSVLIQVLPASPGTVDLVRKKPGIETIAGVGDEAYFNNNADRYAELFVRVGQRLLTLQANANGKVAAVKPGVVNLAKALVAKLS